MPLNSFVETDLRCQNSWAPQVRLSSPPSAKTLEGSLPGRAAAAAGALRLPRPGARVGDALPRRGAPEGGDVDGDQGLSSSDGGSESATRATRITRNMSTYK